LAIFAAALAAAATGIEHRDDPTTLLRPTRRISPTAAASVTSSIDAPFVVTVMATVSYDRSRSVASAGLHQPGERRIGLDLCRVLRYGDVRNLRS